MTTYYIMLGMITFPALISYSRTRKRDDFVKGKKKYCLFLIWSWVVLSFISGVRTYNVGTDTFAYVSYFLSDHLTHMEPGFLLFVKVMRKITDSPTVFLIVCSLICNGLILLAIYRCSVNPYISVYCYITLYFYFNSFNAIRQYIAVAIVLNSFYYILERKILRFCVLLFIAVSFHSTAIVGVSLLLVLFFDGKREESREHDFGNKLIFHDFFSLMLLFGGILFTYNYLQDLIIIVTKLIPKYGNYLQGELYKYLVTKGGIQQPIVYSLIFLSLVILVNPSYKCRRQLLIPMCIAVILAFGQMKLAIITRILWYFDIFSVLTIPCILKYANLNKKSRVIFSFAVMLISLTFMTYNLHINLQRVRDYQMIF